MWTLPWNRRIQNLLKYLWWSFFAKIVYGSKPLTIFAKSSIFGVWLGSECSSVCSEVLSVIAVLKKLKISQDITHNKVLTMVRIKLSVTGAFPKGREKNFQNSFLEKHKWAPYRKSYRSWTRVLAKFIQGSGLYKFLQYSKFLIFSQHTLA